jgi:hypothetical protein
LPVSAINEAAREDPAAVARLIQAAERVRAAQLGRRTGELSTATAAYRAALAVLVERAVARVPAGGRHVTSAFRTRIGRTLAAAAADPKDRVALRRGQLAHELAPAGFDVFGPTPRALRLVPAARARPPSRPAAAPADDARRQRTREQMRLRTAVATARANLRRLEARADAREKAADRAARHAAAVQQRAEAARQAAETAKAAARQARAQLATAEEALRTAPAPA